MTRRRFLAGAGGAAVTLAIGARAVSSDGGSRPNVLLITADDMDYASLGVTGSKTPGISPNIDALAAAGIRFEHAHVTSAICQPSRSAIMTGRYPHRSGALGFDPINPGVPTLTAELRAAGYYNGILSKVAHIAPVEKFCWDYIAKPAELASGRGPKLYYKKCAEFFAQAKTAGKPFFLMANSEDPHRPFPVKSGEGTTGIPASRYYTADEVEVPGFLPQGIRPVREEIAQYYSGVHRCDETVGEILRALKESGQVDNTLVIFLSDNGMSFPYAKTNCCEASTRTPLIVRWPGKIRPASIDSDGFVSGVDLMPTILDALGVKAPDGMDGRSFLPLLQERPQDGRDHAFTFITRNVSRQEFPMRSVRTKRYSYIYNSWSDGKREFRNESMSGITFRAMQAAGRSDPKIAARVDFFVHRAPQEFYDLSADPYEQNNLIASAEHETEIDRLRGELLKMMKSSGDPLLGQFENRQLR